MPCGRDLDLPRSWPISAWLPISRARASSGKVETGFRRRSCSNKEHDPEKWKPVFREDHAQAKSMIRKSGNRFSEKIMLKKGDERVTGNRPVRTMERAVMPHCALSCAARPIAL